MGYWFLQAKPSRYMRVKNLFLGNGLAVLQLKSS